MRLEQSFEVPVPVGQAWNVLLDIEGIAPCMPGATLTDFDGEKFTGVVKVKLGPVQLTYRGNGRFVERDEPNRRVVITAAGQDNRGGGGAQAKITAQLHEGDSGATTQVNVVADIDIAGRAAQFGRGMIGDVSNKLVKQFADCLAQTIAAQGVPAAAPAGTAALAAPIPAPVAETTPPPPAPAPIPPPIAEAEPIPRAEPAYMAAPADAEEPAVGVAPVPEPEAIEPVTPAAPVAPPPAAPAPVAQSRPARVEAEPIDLLAVSGAKGMARRAAPYLIILLLIVAALIVWAIVS